MPDQDRTDLGPVSSTSILALVRVARHLGLALDPHQLLRARPFDGSEPSTAALIKLAEQSGLSAKRMTVANGDLTKLARVLPAIMLLPNGKRLVLEGVRQGEGTSFLLIHDFEVAGGATALVDEHRLLSVWTGDLLLLKRRWRLTRSE